MNSDAAGGYAAEDRVKLGGYTMVMVTAVIILFMALEITADGSGGCTCLPYRRGSHGTEKLPF